jgi:hypothetical protein
MGSSEKYFWGRAPLTRDSFCMTLGSPLVSPVSQGCQVLADRRQRILGYRDANHPRPMPKAATPAPTSISASL